MKKIVNRQVEKQIAKLRSEILLTNRNLREELSAALRERLRQLVEEEAEQSSACLMKLDREKRMPRRLRKVDVDYRNITKHDERDRKPSRNRLDASTDTSDISNDDSSQPGKCEQEESLLISSDFTETSQLAGHEGRGGSKSHAKLCFVTRDKSCSEDTWVQLDGSKEEEALLMKRQWKEWMDKQEMKINLEQEKPQSSEKQSEAEVPVSVSETQINPNMKTRKEWKFKTYLSDLFNPRTSYKWQRFENDD